MPRRWIIPEGYTKTRTTGEMKARGDREKARVSLFQVKKDPTGKVRLQFSSLLICPKWSGAGLSFGSQSPRAFLTLSPDFTFRSLFTIMSFVEELWSSVFTPGPTPTLLVATNVTFAALQLVLFVLLLATYSVHFVVLSFLCAGLWYSINWFAHEVRLAQQAQEAEKKAQAESEPGSDRKKDSVDSADSDTETEAVAGKKPKKSPKDYAVTTGSAASARLQPTQRDPAKRASPGGDSSGYGSTDSEWEKVEDNRP